MSKYNIYRDIQVSLIRFCKDFGDPRGLSFLNLDAHTEGHTWPEGDLIGFGELNITMDATDEVMVSFAIGTEGDPNLLRMSELVNELANLLIPGENIPVLDAETGLRKSWLFVAGGVRIGSPIDTKSQSLQPIMVRLLGDHRNF